MRLLIDTSSIFMRACFSKEGQDYLITYNYNFSGIYDYVFDEILNFCCKYDIDDFVFAFDAKKDGKYWRNNFYPYYKFERKKIKSILDKEKIKQGIDDFFEVLKKYKQFKVVKINGAEADDIIAVLCEKGGIVYSPDKDFRQLVNDKCKLYDPMKGIFVEYDEKWLVEHVIKGDISDSIVNVYTDPIDKYENKKRSKSIYSHFVNECYYEYKERGWEGVQEKLGECFLERNKKLVLFDYIPEKLKELVRKADSENIIKDNEKLYNMFMDLNVKNPIDKSSRVFSMFRNRL